MKITIAMNSGTMVLKRGITILVLGLCAHAGVAQFTGKLVYQVDGEKFRLVMTYYQSGSLGHMEAYNIKATNGVTDTNSLKPQDTLLWDFSKGYETHLVFRTNLALMMSYAMKADMAAKMGAKMGGSVTVTSQGTETVNGYKCTHYVLTSQSKMGSGTRDIWITNDLGAAPTAWVVGSYLYYTPGEPQLTKLQAAGANGIVVKAVYAASGIGEKMEMNLISVDKHTPKVYFTTPSRYTVNDQTGMTTYPGPTH